MSYKSKSMVPFIRRTSFRLFTLFIVSAYIMAVLIWQQHYLGAPEALPVFIQPTASMQRLATKVEVGLHINSFLGLSFQNNDFIIDAILWFKFPAATESLESIENFTFNKSLIQQNGELHFKAPPIIKLMGEDVLVCYHVQTELRSRFNYRYFPLGGHKLNIVINNRAVTPHELCFYSSEKNFVLADEVLEQSWRPDTTTVTTGYVESCLQEGDKTLSVKYPSVVFSINFKNSGMRDIILLYFPIFVLFFIALFSLLIDVLSESRLTFVGGLVPMLVLFRIVIDQDSPLNVRCATHIDVIYYFIVFLSLLILFFQAYVMLVRQKYQHDQKFLVEQGVPHLEFWNDIVFLGSLGLLIVFMTYTCFR